MKPIVRSLTRISIASLLFLLLTVIKSNLPDLLSPFFMKISQETAVIVFKIVSALRWVVLAFLASELISALFLLRIQKKEGESAKPKLFKDILVILIYFLAAAIIMHRVFNQPLSGIWFTSGAVALILGFALRNIILDLFSGVAVNIEKPYRIGDWVEIHQRFSTHSIIGKITEMNWRSTHLRTEQNTNVVIPNSLITTMSVTTNFWHQTKPTRYEAKFTLDFSVNHERVIRILKAGALEAYLNPGFVGEQPPQVLIDETTDRGIEYKVRYWITPWQNVSPSMANHMVHACVLKHLAASGLTPAYPKQNVFHGALPPRQLDPVSESDRIHLLAQNDLFSMLTQHELHRLSASMIKHTFSEGQYIFNQNEAGNSMYILFEGFAKVYMQNGPNELPVGKLTPPDYFGEMSLLTGEPRMATVKCVTTCVVFEINHESFNELIAGREQIIDQIAETITNREARNASMIEENEKETLRKKSELRESILKKIHKLFSVTWS
jgi:small-conductance mechanosensitive channel/CRP-like cAMP-binding protein